MSNKESEHSNTNVTNELIEFDRQIAAMAPKCHFKPMKLDWGGDEEGWWECGCCGHTKPLNLFRGEQ